MSNNNNNKSNKLKFYKSIPVQILFLNILMFLVFNVVSFLVNGRIASMTSNAQGIITGVTDLVPREGTAKEDLAKFDGKLQSALGLWAYYADTDKERIGNELKDGENEVTSIIKGIGEEFAMYGNPTATATLESYISALFANSDEIFNIMMTTGDGAAAAELYMGEYTSNMAGVQKGFEELDLAVEELQVNVNQFMAGERSAITRVNVIGVVLFII